MTYTLEEYVHERYGVRVRDPFESLEEGVRRVTGKPNFLECTLDDLEKLRIDLETQARIQTVLEAFDGDPRARSEEVLLTWLDAKMEQVGFAVHGEPDTLLTDVLVRVRWKDNDGDESEDWKEGAG